MDKHRTVADWMADRGLDLAKLVAAAALEPKVAEAIVGGRYTPSPEQRQRIAAALGAAPEEISWGHGIEVQHLYGHGPQFGRTP